MDLEDVKGWFTNMFGSGNNEASLSNQKSNTNIVTTKGDHINYEANTKQWYKNDKIINTNKYYYYDSNDGCYKTLNKNGFSDIAPRYVDTGKPIVPKIIGGSRKQSQIDYYKQYPEQNVVIRQVAKELGLNPNLLQSRYTAEGSIDNNININNKNINNNVPIYKGNPLDYWDNPKQVYDTKALFGADDTYTMYKEGKIKLPKGVSFTSKSAPNVHGRIVHYLQGNTNRDNLYIMGAALKYFRDVAKQKHPKANDNELDAWASAIYHNGIVGSNRIKTLNYLKNHYTSLSKDAYLTINPNF